MIRCIVLLFLISNVSCKYFWLPAGSPCEWNGIPGRCVTANQCVTAIKDIANRDYPPICSFDGNIPVICCTDCDLTKDIRLMVENPVLGKLFKTGKSKAKDKCIDYLHTLDYSCKKGLPPLPPTKKMLDVISNCTYEGSELRQGTGFTSGGRNANREEYPHMALLGFGYTIESAIWLCGGSVISERFILTAAHCVLSRSKGTLNFVALGILKRTDPPSLWQTYNVQTAIPHPDYKPPFKYHDIALLRTNREILFSPSVLPACLHVDDKKELTATATATGWGALGHNNIVSDVLQSVSLRKYEDEKCSEMYPKHRHLTRGIDTSTQMCYGDTENEEVPTDTCQGDSGGPLQIPDNRKCMYTILGVTSYGRKHCGLSRSPSVYTRVMHYITWIEDIVWP